MIDDTRIKAIVDRARVARLATVDSDCKPHLIPVVFVFDNNCYLIPIDEKHKGSPPENLPGRRDQGNSVIRIDGMIRMNAGVGMGDTVRIQKIKAVSAEKVTVAPLEPLPQSFDIQYLADALEGVPLILGDTIRVPYLGGGLSFRVAGMTPNDIVVVTHKTVFQISEYMFVSKEEWEKNTKPFNAEDWK